VLMTTFLHEAGIDVEPLRVALWGIPTAISAFVIHAWRLRRLDQSLEREFGGGGNKPNPLSPATAVNEAR